MGKRILSVKGKKERSWKMREAETSFKTRRKQTGKVGGQTRRQIWNSKPQQLDIGMAVIHWTISGLLLTPLNETCDK